MCVCVCVFVQVYTSVSVRTRSVIGCKKQKPGNIVIGMQFARDNLSRQTDGNSVFESPETIRRNHMPGHPYVYVRVCMYLCVDVYVYVCVCTCAYVPTECCSQLIIR